MFTLIRIHTWELKWNTVISNLNWRVYYTFLVSHGYPCNKLSLGKKKKKELEYFYLYNAIIKIRTYYFLPPLAGHKNSDNYHKKIEVKTRNKKIHFWALKWKFQKLHPPPTTFEKVTCWKFWSLFWSQAKLNFMKGGSKASSLKAAASSTLPAEQRWASESTRFHRPIGERQTLIRLLLCHTWNSKTFLAGFRHCQSTKAGESMFYFSVTCFAFVL